MNSDVIFELINAWNTGNAEVASNLYFENIWFRDSANPNGLSGNFNLTNYLSWLSSSSPETSFKIIDVVELDTISNKNFSYYIKWRYFVPDSLAGKDHIYIVDGIQYLEFENNLLICSECFYDQLPLLAELLVSSDIIHNNCNSLKGSNIINTN